MTSKATGLAGAYEFSIGRSGIANILKSQNSEAEITLDGIAVARISRSYMNANELVFGQQTYYLTVAPGGQCSVPHRLLSEPTD